MSGLNRLGRSSKKRSQRQESRIAEESGGQPTLMSGASWFQKNDVRTPTESWEAKTTRGRQFILKLEELRRAWTQSVVDNRRMVWEIEFGDERYVVLNKDDYIELRDWAGS
jgi:hypothetical protein